jgi:transposase
MGTAVRLREDYDAAVVRRLARTARDPKQVRRLLALAAVYDGADRARAARIGGMDRQTLRDWVHRFNRLGPDGLVNVKPPGPARKLTEAQEEEVGRLVEAGPDPETDGVVRWRCADLRRVIKERFSVDLDEVSVGRLLKRLGYAHVSARPRHPAQDPEAMAAHKKTFPSASARS